MVELLLFNFSYFLYTSTCRCFNLQSTRSPKTKLHVGLFLPHVLLCSLWLCLVLQSQIYSRFRSTLLKSTWWRALFSGETNKGYILIHLILDHWPILPLFSKENSGLFGGQVRSCLDVTALNFLWYRLSQIKIKKHCTRMCRKCWKILFKKAFQRLSRNFMKGRKKTIKIPFFSF